ncbi:MAG: restriction endonuclease subunit S [Luteibaculaceae bacterium]
MKKQQQTPKLRFPEFTQAWEIKKLGEVATFYSGGTPLTSKKQYFNGNIPFIRSGEINSKNTEQFITEEGLKNSSAKMVKVGDILYALYGATSGEVGISKINGAINQAVLCIKSSQNSYYIYSVLKFKKEIIIKTFLQGGQGNLSAEIVKNISISFPTLPEQTKIAQFLTAVDEKLQALKKKKELLEAYKKGAMQRIFSQQLRFKDENGNDFPDWEKKKLGEVFSFKVTNSFSRENLNYKYGQIKNIHYGDIHTKFKILFDVSKEVVPFVNPEISISRISTDNYCKEGDVIFADASEDLNDVGKSIEIVNLGSEKVLAGLHTILARPETGFFCIGFLGYLFSSNNIRTQIQKESQGSKVLSISVGRLSSINIAVPSIPEQTKIANFLSALDEKINVQSRLIASITQWKKGLLQQMFV